MTSADLFIREILVVTASGGPLPEGCPHMCRLWTLGCGAATGPGSGCVERLLAPLCCFPDLFHQCSCAKASPGSNAANKCSLSSERGSSKSWRHLLVPLKLIQEVVMELLPGADSFSVVAGDRWGGGMVPPPPLASTWGISPRFAPSDPSLLFMLVFLLSHPI